MREIKFRGKRKDNEQWVTGCLLIEEPPLQCFTPKNPEPNKYLIGKSGFADWNMQRPFTAAEVHPESVGQFTGLKDKNGKEIYEGDILYVEDPYGENNKKFSVEFNNGVCEIRWDSMFNDGCDVTAIHYAMETGFTFEVIGNIYDNPELLK